MDRLLPEIKDVILDILTQLEAKDVDIEMLDFDNIIVLLKTHRNKKMIRKIIYDNIEKIINYYVLEIDTDELYNLDYISTLHINTNLMLQIINDNEKEILKNYSIYEKENYINSIKNNNNDFYNIVIGKSYMNDLIFFIYDLIINNEIILAKKCCDISKNYIAKHYDFEYHLLESLLCAGDINFLKVIIEFVGEDKFISTFQNIISIEGFNSDYLYLFNNILRLEKYELLKQFLNCFRFNYKIYNSNILKDLYEAVNLKNNDLIKEYIIKFCDLLM